MTTNRTRITGAAAVPSQPPPISELIDRLSRFDGPPDQFLMHMLAVQCVISSSAAGAILRPGGEGRAEALAVYPPVPKGATPAVWLAQAAEMLLQVLASGETTTRDVRSPEDLYGAPADRHVVLLPIRAGTAVRGMAAFLVETSSLAALEAARQRLELSLSLLSLYEMRVTLQARQVDLQRLRAAMEVLSAVNEPEKFAGAAMAMVNEVSSRWQCHRVGLGFLRGRYVQLKALSHTEKFSRKMQLVQDIEAAMEECLDQDVEVLHPPPEGSTFVSRAAGELSLRQGPTASLGVPLRRRGEVVGVLTLERPPDKPFGVEEIEVVRLACDLCAPRLVGLHETDRWIGARAAQTVRKGLAVAVGPKHTWLKVAALAVFAAVLFMVFAKGDYQVQGSFVLQAEKRQILPAPFDGTIESVNVKIGDRVVAGQTVLAKLKTQDLEGELAKAKADIVDYTKQAALARAAAAYDETKRAEAQIADARADKAKAQVRLLEYRIEQASMTSPIDGIVLVDGDLWQRLGSPVKTGDALFEVSPLDVLRADVYVSEDQIADVREDLTGELAATGYPERRIRFRVERIDPVAQVKDQKNAFTVRARLEGVDLEGREAWLRRAGLEGVARIDVDRRSYGRLWTRRMVNWVRMKLWL